MSLDQQNFRDWWLDCKTSQGRAIQIEVEIVIETFHGIEADDPKALSVLSS